MYRALPTSLPDAYYAQREDAARLVNAYTALCRALLRAWHTHARECAATLGALLKASNSLTTLDLSGSSCMAAALARISKGLKASTAPLAELRLGGLIHGEGAANVAARLAALVRGACRPSLRLIDCPSLRLIDCTKQAGGKAGEYALFAAEGEGVVASLAALTSMAGQRARDGAAGRQRRVGRG